MLPYVFVEMVFVEITSFEVARKQNIYVNSHTILLHLSFLTYKERAEGCTQPIRVLVQQHKILVFTPSTAENQQGGGKLVNASTWRWKEVH